MNETPNLPLEDAPQSSAPANPLSWVKRHWGVIVAVVVPVVTVATIVIPLIADAGVRMTSVDTLVVSDKPTDDADVIDLSEVQAAVSVGLASRELYGEASQEIYPNDAWRLPIDAPWDTLPLDASEDSYFCTPEQIAWLEQWGRRDIADVWGGYLTLNNAATDGASMSVRNIRSVGTFVEPESLEVEVNCATGRGGFSEIIPLIQELGSDTPAVFELDYGSAPAGSPAVLNMAPGEYLQLSMFFDQDLTRTSDFSGNLVADVVIGDETTEVALFEGFTRGGAPAIQSTSLTIGGHFVYCGDNQIDPCSMADFLSQLTSDPAYKD